MALTRNTRVVQRTQVFHFECPEQPVHGAPMPTMRIEAGRQAEDAQVFICPLCRTKVALRTLQDVGR